MCQPRMAKIHRDNKLPTPELRDISPLSTINGEYAQHQTPHTKDANEHVVGHEVVHVLISWGRAGARRRGFNEATDRPEWGERVSDLHSLVWGWTARSRRPSAANQVGSGPKWSRQEGRQKTRGRHDKTAPDEPSTGRLLVIRCAPPPPRRASDAATASAAAASGGSLREPPQEDSDAPSRCSRAGAIAEATSMPDAACAALLLDGSPAPLTISSQAQAEALTSALDNECGWKK